MVVVSARLLQTHRRRSKTKAYPPSRRTVEWCSPLPGLHRIGDITRLLESRHVPLGPQQWELRHCGVLDLLSHLCRRSAYAVVHRNGLVGSEEVLDGIIGVTVGRDEVHRHV